MNECSGNAIVHKNHAKVELPRGDQERKGAIRAISRT